MSILNHPQLRLPIGKPYQLVEQDCEHAVAALPRRQRGRHNTTYIPHVEDVIWHEFLRPLLRPKRRLRDAQ
jgi:hypothetical protein